MGTYKMELSLRICRMCSRLSTFEVFNCKNSSVGFYCRSHGAAKVRELDEADD